jgi:hypothetical protein
MAESGFIDRQQIEERRSLSADEKLKIKAKTSGRCVHCGKTVHFGVNGTIDHFVPVSQGGRNLYVNLVPMCKDCNSEKADKIYSPELYLKYLNKEDFDALVAYFDSYVRSFKFFKRRNILACDLYPMEFSMNLSSSHAKFRHKSSVKVASINLIRVTADDIDKVTKYYIWYLKKVGKLDAESTARHNIEFWYNFATIYYTEKDGQISHLCVVCLTKDFGNTSEDDLLTVNHCLSVIIMPRYNNLVNYKISESMATYLPDMVVREQNLNYIPVNVMTIGSEPLLGKLGSSYGYRVYANNSFMEMKYILAKKVITKEESSSMNSAVDGYIGQFDILESQMDKYLKETGYSDVSWMKQTFIDRTLGTD